MSTCGPLSRLSTSQFHQHTARLGSTIFIELYNHPDRHCDAMDEILNRRPEFHELLLANLRFGQGSTTCCVYVLPIEFQSDSYHFGQEMVVCLMVRPLRARSMTFANIFDF